MRTEIVNRRSGFNADSRAQSQVFQERAGEGVTDEVVEDVTAIRVQEADGELVPQHVQQSRREVKQGTDARIALTVVIAERTLVVASQRGPAIVRAQLPAFAEILADLNFNRLVGANRVHET